MGSENSKVWHPPGTVLGEPMDKAEGPEGPIPREFGAARLDFNPDELELMSKDDFEIRPVDLAAEARWDLIEPGLRGTERFREWERRQIAAGRAVDIREYAYYHLSFLFEPQVGVFTRRRIPKGTIFAQADLSLKGIHMKCHRDSHVLAIMMNDRNYQYFMPQAEYQDVDRIRERINVRQVFVTPDAPEAERCLYFQALVDLEPGTELSKYYSEDYWFGQQTQILDSWEHCPRLPKICIQAEWEQTAQRYLDQQQAQARRIQANPLAGVSWRTRLQWWWYGVPTLDWDDPSTLHHHGYIPFSFQMIYHHLDQIMEVADRRVKWANGRFDVLILMVNRLVRQHRLEEARSLVQDVIEFQDSSYAMCPKYQAQLLLYRKLNGEWTDELMFNMILGNAMRLSDVPPSSRTIGLLQYLVDSDIDLTRGFGIEPTGFPLDDLSLYLKVGGLRLIPPELMHRELLMEALKYPWNYNSLEKLDFPTHPMVLDRIQELNEDELAEVELDRLGWSEAELNQDLLRQLLKYWELHPLTEEQRRQYNGGLRGIRYRIWRELPEAWKVELDCEQIEQANGLPRPEAD